MEYKMSKDLYEVRVLVRNRAIPKYEHKDNTYICGFEDTEFEIELVNNSDDLVLMIPSVDGLSVIDGQEASENSQGYLVRPKNTTKIPGWTLDNDSVAKFKFADKKKSYAALHPDSPKTDNVGVIGVIVYSRKPKENEKLDTILERIKELEKKNPIVINPIYPWYDWYDWNYFRQSRPYIMPTIFNGSPSIGTPNWSSGGFGTRYCINNITCNAANIAQSSVSNSCQTVGSALLSNVSETESMADQTLSLGTEFGASIGFKTDTVSFERNAIVATLVVYYDSKKNLEKRGIIVSSFKEEPKTPNPFPKLGCTPPKGWSEKS